MRLSHLLNQIHPVHIHESADKIEFEYLFFRYINTYINTLKSGKNVERHVIFRCFLSKLINQEYNI